ncbi:MAG: hypothetical protein ACRDYC_03875 [Acidimicrobiales bacterium]
MAYGLAVEGDDGPFVGQMLREVPTCPVDATVGEAKAALADGGGTSLVVVDAAGLALGIVDIETMADHGEGDRILDLMAVVPSAVRPSVLVSTLVDTQAEDTLVSSSDGRLLGVWVTDDRVGRLGHRSHNHDHDQGKDDMDDHDHHDHDHDHDHEHDHDHHEHDHDDMDAEMAAVLAAVTEHFGDREPSEEELHAFLRDRLIAEGRTPVEADRVLAEMGDEDAP